MAAVTLSLNPTAHVDLRTDKVFLLLLWPPPPHSRCVGCTLLLVDHASEEREIEPSSRGGPRGGLRVIKSSRLGKVAIATRNRNTI